MLNGQLRIRFVAKAIIAVALIVNLAPPYVAGLYYNLSGEHQVEQGWLDEAIQHLKVLKTRTNDPDLQNVLDYAIARYSKIGPWDVAIMPCFSVPGSKTIGCNQPLCPGITIDPEVLLYDIHDGSMVLVHESLHDWWPCWGHAHVTPRMEKLEQLR